MGMTITQAQRLAARCHYDLTYIYRVPDSARAGKVISQSPPFSGDRLVVSTGPLKNAWAILPGAKNRPVKSECTRKLLLDEDGNAGPLFCANGHVNVEAWEYFSLEKLTVMTLPRASSECQVAYYINRPYLTVPINDSAFQLANAYNGWRVPEGLAAHILVSTPYKDPCPS